MASCYCNLGCKGIWCGSVECERALGDHDATLRPVAPRVHRRRVGTAGDQRPRRQHGVQPPRAVSPASNGAFRRAFPWPIISCTTTLWSAHSKRGPARTCRVLWVEPTAKAVGVIGLRVARLCEQAKDTPRAARGDAFDCNLSCVLVFRLRPPGLAPRGDATGDRFCNLS